MAEIPTILAALKTLSASDGLSAAGKIFKTIQSFGSVLVIVAGGAMAWGHLESKVGNLDDGQHEIKAQLDKAALDHDQITQHTQQLHDLHEDVTEMKGDIKQLIRQPAHR
jgi:hypothetical protein